MTREEAIYCLDHKDIVNPVEFWTAVGIAIEALKREQQLLDAGYQNATVDFYIGGRLFRAKEIAQ